MKIINANTLKQIFKEAGYILSQKGIIGEIVLFSGGALIFAFDERVFTKDIDAYLKPKEEVENALVEAGKKFGLKGEWINTDVLRYVYSRPPQKLASVFEGKNLRVFRPSKEYILALKILVSRAERDFEDALLLAKALKAVTEEDLKNVFFSVFPKSYLDERRKLFIEEIAATLAKEKKTYENK